MQAIHSYSIFSPGVSSVAQISKLEELVKDDADAVDRTILEKFFFLRCLDVFPVREGTYSLAVDRSYHVFTSEGKCTSVRKDYKKLDADASVQTFGERTRTVLSSSRECTYRWRTTGNGDQSCRG